MYFNFVFWFHSRVFVTFKENEARLRLCYAIYGL